MSPKILTKTLPMLPLRSHISMEDRTSMQQINWLRKQSLFINILFQNYSCDMIEFLICGSELPGICRVLTKKDLSFWFGAEQLSWKAQIWSSASIWGEEEKGVKCLAMAVFLLLIFLFSFTTSLQVSGKSLSSAEYGGLQVLTHAFLVSSLVDSEFRFSHSM